VQQEAIPPHLSKVVKSFVFTNVQKKDLEVATGGQEIVDAARQILNEFQIPITEQI
jgi:hypothetical protein